MKLLETSVVLELEEGLELEDHFLEKYHYPGVLEFKGKAEPVDWPLNFNWVRILAEHVPVSLKLHVAT